MFVLTETWLNREIAYSELSPDHADFYIYRYARLARRGGGVLLGLISILLYLNFLLTYSLNLLHTKWCGFPLAQVTGE